MTDPEEFRLELYRATHQIKKLRENVAALWVFVALLMAAMIFT